METGMEKPEGNNGKWKQQSPLSHLAKPIPEGEGSLGKPLGESHLYRCIYGSVMFGLTASLDDNFFFFLIQGSHASG